MGAISPGPHQPALHGASAHGGRTRRCGPGTAPLVPPERCVAPRRPPATPAPCAAAAAPPGTAARARCGTTRGRHGSRASPPLPSPISVPLPPRFWLFVFFSHLFRLPSAAADPREPRSALGHPRAPPPPPTRECLRSPPQSTPLTPTPGVPVPPPGPSRRRPRTPLPARGAPLGPGPPLGAGGGAHLPGADPGSARPPGLRAGKRRPGPRRHGPGNVLRRGPNPRAVSPRGAGRGLARGAAPVASPFPPPPPHPAEGRRWGLSARRRMGGGGRRGFSAQNEESAAVASAGLRRGLWSEVWHGRVLRRGRKFWVRAELRGGGRTLHERLSAAAGGGRPEGGGGRWV